MDYKTTKIINLLKEVIPNPVCELDFTNSYELICAVLLSAQTTDKRVNIVTKELFKKYPDVYTLKDADIEEVKEIIKSIGLTNSKAKNLIALANEVVNKYEGKIIPDFDILCSLPGVGRKTASVVLAVGFNIPAFPVDTHVERIAKRLKFADESDSVLKVEEKLKAKISKKHWIDAHHLMLLFGRYHCKAISPSCQNCKLKKYCINANEN